MIPRPEGKIRGGRETKIDVLLRNFNPFELIRRRVFTFCGGPERGRESGGVVLFDGGVKVYILSPTASDCTRFLYRHCTRVLVLYYTYVPEKKINK